MSEGLKLMQLLRIANITADVEQEVRDAVEAHGPMASYHDGWAVIFEELDELWDEVREKAPDVAKLRKEAIQVAAMGIRFVLDLCPTGTG